MVLPSLTAIIFGAALMIWGSLTFFVALDVAFAFAKGVEQFVAHFSCVHADGAERIGQPLLYLPIAKL